ncbi:hypothetical protein [Virgibacillus proomii]|uniref:hypothetical protein n=1 Tax=Virgibacillus proomii TaxID=84407 RepID=UPI001C1025D0|nr:hypothetical protein [Virgibacillus proomii]MBU5267884.1 hypothetical protein [Virgibacillus proomii]
MKKNKEIKIGLNTVVQHLNSGDYEQAEELTRKIAFNIPENYNDGFWLDAVMTVIRAVILALAEDVVSAKSEKIDMFSMVNFDQTLFQVNIWVPRFLIKRKGLKT